MFIVTVRENDDGWLPSVKRLKLHVQFGVRPDNHYSSFQASLRNAVTWSTKGDQYYETNMYRLSKIHMPCFLTMFQIAMFYRIKKKKHEVLNNIDTFKRTYTHAINPWPQEGLPYVVGFMLCKSILAYQHAGFSVLRTRVQNPHGILSARLHGQSQVVDFSHSKAKMRSGSHEW